MRQRQRRDLSRLAVLAGDGQDRTPRQTFSVRVVRLVNVPDERPLKLSLPQRRALAKPAWRRQAFQE